jgi:DNA-binding NarL/FixJ family response regulator
VAEAEDARSAYSRYRETSPDVVVMDVTLPGASGIEAIRHIRQYDEAARIVVFTMHQGAAFALKAVEAGAAGYVTKSSDPANLIEAIFGVLEGRTVISPDVIEGIAQDRISGAGSGLDELSTRQTEILRLLASGWPAEKIADALSISLKTVRNNHYQIKSVLGLETDAQMVWFALKTGLVERARADQV